MMMMGSDVRGARSPETMEMCVNYYGLACTCFASRCAGPNRSVEKLNLVPRYIIVTR